MVTTLRRLSLTLLLLAGWAASAAADYKESYRKGVTAADRREWVEVARWMRQAVGERAQEGEPVKIYGVRFEPYVPYYYLGLALFQQGDCEGALAQWQQSEKQGAVQATGVYKALVQSRDTCRRRVAAVAPAASPTPAATPGPDPTALSQATREAESQRARDKEAADRLAREEEARRQREAANAEAARLAAAPTPSATPAPQAVQAEALGPPTELRAAGRAFLRANYPEVVRTLARASFRDPQAAAAGNLLLAAARYSLFLQGGEKNPKLREQARVNVNACRRLDPRLAPDPRAFSPRFAAFFRRP
jgi:hypothetical protein